MAKKLAEFIKSLIVKSGGNVEDEKIKTALATIDANTELQDEIANAIDHGLISITDAKGNHREIKNHYYAAAYNGLDEELDNLMQEEKVPDEVVAEIKAEKSSTKRAGLLLKKIKELESAKAGQGKAETKVLNEKIAELNGELRKIKDNENNLKTEYEKKLRDKDKGYAMRNLLGTYTTIYDKLDPDTKNITINAIIDKNLRSKGFALDVDENGNLVITGKEGSAAFTDDHRPLTPKAFLDKMMGDENLLVVSDNQNNQNNSRNNNTNNNSGGFNNRNNNNNSGGNNNNRNNNQNNQNNNNDSGSRSNSVLKDLLKRTNDDLSNSVGNRVI